MKYFSSILLLLACINSNTVWAWGQTGHRITGQIAEQWLSPEAKIAIGNILGPESLAEASTYPDDMRSAPGEFWQKTANPYHFVTLADGQHYHDTDCPPEGDSVSALKHFTRVLQRDDSTTADKQLALRFIVHLIGDLHQPLHVSSAKVKDKGGNAVPVTFFKRQTNLHKVWDSDLIDQQKLSFSEYASWLNAKITHEQHSNWSAGYYQQWVSESAALRDGVYPLSPELGWDYLYQHNPTVKVRLQQAGVRIAAHFNRVFSGN
jgi:hypothetical protein